MMARTACFTPEGVSVMVAVSSIGFLEETPAGGVWVMRGGRESTIRDTSLLGPPSAATLSKLPVCAEGGRMQIIFVSDQYFSVAGMPAIETLSSAANLGPKYCPLIVTKLERLANAEMTSGA